MIGFAIGAIVAWMLSIAVVWWLASTDGYDRGRLDLAAELAEKKLRAARNQPPYRARHDTATRPRLEVVTGGKAATTGGKAATATAARPPAPSKLPAEYVTAADLAPVTVPPAARLTTTGEMAAVTDEYIHNMRYTEDQYRKELATS